MKVFKKWLVSFLALILLTSSVDGLFALQAESNETEEAEWELVWQDEFDGDEINMDNWTFDHPENGRYNQEIQSYTEDNAWIEDGKLVIEAREEQITEPNGETYNYTSSKLITQGKQSWQYGRFEIMAKLPEGQGMWPAIWMMPEDEPFYGTWPVGGEIDIMELLGHEPHKVHQNIHYGEPHGDAPNSYTLREGTFADDFHEFALEWEPGEIRWYIDDELVHTANDWFSKHPSNADQFAYPAPFDQPFHLILNISVGGGWPGNPDDTTPLPQQMLVDYVRVYQKDEYPVREAPERPDLGEGRAPLADGNYIYNGDFSSGMDEWTHYSDGGDFELNVGDNELHVAITNGGSVEHGVQVLQDLIHLEKGAKYKASFTARAEESRPLKLKIGGGGGRGYADYANIDPITLTTDLVDYEFEFTMSERTDLEARFEFNMGLDAADIWLSGVRLEMIEEAPEETETGYQPRAPLSNGNYIYNGTFDQGNDRMSFWEFKTDDNADATYYIGSAMNERRFDAFIENGGNTAEAIQLIQPEINLAEGNSYQLTFDASADNPRSIEVSFVAENGNTVASETIELSTSTEQYTVDFSADVVTDNNVELRFNIGGSDENVFIDNVVLNRVLGSDGIENNIIRNGIFDSLAHWSTENNHSTASFGVGDEGFQVNITDAGYDTWAIQLYQRGVALEEGENYLVSFDARSTTERPIIFHIEHATDYTDYFATNIDLAEEWTTYNYEFTMGEPSDSDSKFGFSLGGANEQVDFRFIEHDIFINNVVLTKVEDEEKTPGEDSDDPIVDSEDQILDLKNRIEELENQQLELTEELEQELAALRAEIEALQVSEQGLDIELADLLARVIALENRSSELEEENGEETDSDEVETDRESKVVDQDGETLPKTATSIYNLLLIGALIIIVGAGFALYSKKRKSE